LRHIRHFDMRFEKKIADIRRAFVSTSVENVSGLEASATDMQSFLQESTKRIAVLKERAQNLAAERPLHHVAIELLVLCLCLCLWCVLAPHPRAGRQRPPEGRRERLHGRSCDRNSQPLGHEQGRGSERQTRCFQDVFLVSSLNASAMLLITRASRFRCNRWLLSLHSKTIMSQQG
jgi:hypothetical protein